MKPSITRAEEADGGYLPQDLEVPAATAVGATSDAQRVGSTGGKLSLAAGVGLAAMGVSADVAAQGVELSPDINTEVYSERDQREVGVRRVILVSLNSCFRIGSV